MTVRRRLLATYLGISFALVAIVGGLLYDNVVAEARNAIETVLANEVRMIATDLAATGWPSSAVDLDEWVDDLATASNARLTIISPGGRVVADSEFDGSLLAALDNHGSRTEVREAWARGEGRSLRYSRSVDVEMLYRARRIDSGPWAGGVARMAVPLTMVESARRSALVELGAALALALAGAIPAAWLVSRWVGRPVQALHETAERLLAGDLNARARVQTDDELEDLAEALNAATARLADRIAAATAERHRLEGVLDAMVEGVIVTDRRRRVALANTALLGLFGVDGPVEGRTPLELLRSPEVADALDAAARSEKPSSYEIRLRWPRERTLALSAVPLEAGGAVGVFHDVTERQRLDAMRRDFVANVGHELRTPLATLGGYAEELADSLAEPEEIKRSVEVIRRHVARMTTLVEDLLVLARLEAEGFAPDREPIDAASFVEELAQEWSARAAQRGMSIVVEPSEARIVTADRRLLRQALAHLLDNALKYSAPGTTVRLSTRATVQGTELRVSDEGPGIPIGEQPRIFERFYRIEKGRSRDTGGTGLGLAIVKHVAEALGGFASVESRPGRGATFRIVLPDGGARR